MLGRARSALQGGLYNSSNVAQYQASLAAIDDHMTAAQAAQIAQLQEIKKQLLQQVRQQP